MTIFSPVSAQDWRTGLTAFEAVDYTLAQKVWIPLAEAVDASSQESAEEQGPEEPTPNA